MSRRWAQWLVYQQEYIMLSDKTIEIVKSTVPLLAQAGTVVTDHFYKRMFSQHPELRNIFNMKP